MDEFHFLRPWWFVAFIPLALIVRALLQESRQQGLWGKVCDPALLSRLLLRHNSERHTLGISLFAIVVALIIVACAGPVWEKIPQPLYVKKSPLVIALDVSKSMAVADIKPSRIVRARLKLEDLLNERKDGQTALIVYTSHPFVVTPLTLDTKTIKLHVSNLDTKIAPVQGSRPGLALKKSAELLKNANVKTGQVLLITDNLVGIEVFSEARKLAAKGIKTSVLIVGSKEGGPIPHDQGDFVQRDTKLIIDKVDEGKIKQFINISGGRYHSITADDSDLRYLLAAEYRASASDFELLKLKSQSWQEQGPWLLLLVLPLAALVFRKGWIAVVIVVILPVPELAVADTWNELWLNKDQQGLKLFHKGEHEKALEKFKSQQWKGAAYYRMGRYKEAYEFFSLDQSANGFYNQGNALAKMGQFEKAISAYRKTLELDGQHNNARLNLKLLEDYLSKKKSQQPNLPGSNQADSQSGDSQQQSQQQGGQSNSDQQSQSGQSSDANNTNNNSSGVDQQTGNGSNNQDGDAGQNENQKLKQLEAEMRKGNSKQSKPGVAAGPEQEQDNEQTQDNQLSQSDQYMLQQLQDDPGLLLRRKFQRQYDRDKRSNNYPYLPTEPW